MLHRVRKFSLYAVHFRSTAFVDFKLNFKQTKFVRHNCHMLYFSGYTHFIVNSFGSYTDALRRMAL